ncbi:unnamed protein product [Lactuca saligna]|uniref:Uncharacterized protein n=1 Tax=Lactuca saligna TaxID=75948 RepID=A0AA35YHN2_LACSI|nr:unnamed protein product [Lactuca saligna]
MLATQKTLFPPCSIERFQKGAVDEPSTHWAFLFRCFQKIEIVPLSDSDVNHMLFSFYLKYGKPQFQVWSLQNIVAMKVCAPFPADDFINMNFIGFGGTKHTEFEFTLADLPSMNPHDWICLLMILSKDE